MIGYVSSSKFVVDPCKPNPCSTPKSLCTKDDNEREGYKCNCPVGKMGNQCQFDGKR